MRRIGAVASRMSRGNIWLYNFYVVLVSCLVSFFIFIVVGATILFSLIIISYLGMEIMPVEMQHGWSPVMMVCMLSLTVVVVLFNLIAILRNVRLTRRTKMEKSTRLSS